MSWLQGLDESLFRFVNQTLSNPLFDVLMPWLSGSRLFIPLAIIGAVFLIRRGRSRAVLFLLMLGIAAGVSDGLVCKTLKAAIGRERPCAALENVHLLVGCGQNGSMPSSHASNMFAAAMVALLFYRRSAWVMFPLAVAVSFSRVANGVHYPSDILVGAILGAGTGFAVVFGLNSLWRFVGAKWFPLWHARLPSLVPGTAATNHAPRATHHDDDTHWFRAGCLFIVVATLARWLYLASGTIELSEDEAYQWIWSKHLALSYYSKPPLIALTQFLGTSLWGDTAFGVRFFSPLIAAVLGFMLLRFFAREVNGRAGFFLVLIVTATPLLSVGATLLTVDPLAVLFWTAAMLSGWRAVQDNSRTSAWLLTGLWMGLGFLSKYTSPLAWMCWAVFFIVWPPARKHLRTRGPWLALLVNLLCTLPVIVWNMQNDWITLKHVARHGGVGKASVPLMKHLSYFAEFLGAEIFLLNPFFFVATAIALIAMWFRTKRDARLVYLFCMGAPVFILYIFLSFKSRVQPNWVAPSVLPMFAVMVIYWDERFRFGVFRVKWWLTAGLIVGLLFVAVLKETRLVERVTGHELPAKIDPLKRVRSHSTFGKTVEEARTILEREGKPTFIIGDHYGVTSLMTFYIPEAKRRVVSDPLVFVMPSEVPRNQFYFWPGYGESRKGQNAIFVAQRDDPKLVKNWIVKWCRGEPFVEPVKASDSPPPALFAQFESVKSIGFREIKRRGQIYQVVELYECRNLR
jgi:membrane-associated phospholipid phosphatase